MYFSFNILPLNEEVLYTNMNIDKFGHHVHKRLRVSELLDFQDKALLKKDSGEYDLQSSALKGVKRPQFADEAVNKEYLDEVVNSLSLTINGELVKVVNFLERQYVTKDYLQKKLDLFAKK